MKQVILLGTRPRKLKFPIISWMIRLIEWSSISHVALYFPEQNLVRHAHFNDIKEETYSAFCEENKVIKNIPLNLKEASYLKIDQYTKSKLGKQTGYFCTLFGSLVPEIIRKYTGLIIKNPFVKGILCSEFVRQAMEETGIILVSLLTSSIPNGNFTTTDAVQLFEKLSDF